MTSAIRRSTGNPTSIRSDSLQVLNMTQCWNHHWDRQKLEIDSSLNAWVISASMPIYEILGIEDLCSAEIDRRRSRRTQSRRSLLATIKTGIGKNSLQAKVTIRLIEPRQLLVHRIEEARRVANRKRDDRQKCCWKITPADLRPAAARNSMRPHQMSSPNAYSCSSTPDTTCALRDICECVSVKE